MRTDIIHTSACEHTHSYHWLIGFPKDSFGLGHTLALCEWNSCMNYTPNFPRATALGAALSFNKVCLKNTPITSGCFGLKSLIISMWTFRQDCLSHRCSQHSPGPLSTGNWLAQALPWAGSRWGSIALYSHRLNTTTFSWYQLLPYFIEK